MLPAEEGAEWQNEGVGGPPQAGWVVHFDERPLRAGRPANGDVEGRTWEGGVETAQCIA